MSQQNVFTPDEAAAWSRDLYDNGVDKMDAVRFGSVFTDDAWLRFGNNDPVVGRSAIEAAIAGFFTTIGSLRHESAGTWCQGDALILQANVTYDRRDGGEVTVPAVTIFQLKRSEEDPSSPPMAHRCQMFVDLTPLYAPAPV